MKKDIRAYGYDRLKDEMEALGEKQFRAKQVYEIGRASCRERVLESV